MISSAVLGCPLPTCCDGSLKTHTKRLSYYLIEFVLVAAFALTLVAIVGLHALQRGRYGRLEAAGSLLTLLGYAIVLVSAHLTTLAGGEPIYFARLMGGLAMLIGSALLGVMTLYARVLPWWCGVLLILGFPLDDLLDLVSLSKPITVSSSDRLVNSPDGGKPHGCRRVAHSGW